MRRCSRSLFALMLLGLIAMTNAFAHKASDAYLTLAVEGSEISGQWDIALRDLDYAIGVDGDGDGVITWGELRARHDAIAAYALTRLRLRAGGADCALRVTEHLVDEHSDGGYAVMRLAARCDKPIATLTVDYRLFADLDPQHRGIMRFDGGGATRALVFGPESASQALELARPSVVATIVQYVREGAWHIWIGFDHILFLVSLLLPAVLVRTGRRWAAVETFRAALWDVVKVVTAFTVAHSITLVLATLGVVSLPSRWIESAIAASVIVAALNNLYPIVTGRRALVAFGFGLIHGFGFATVLTERGLPAGTLVAALASFNVGVELGQLAIVAVFLPIAYALRRGMFYQRGVLSVGSGLIAVLAGFWLYERLTG